MIVHRAGRPDPSDRSRVLPAGTRYDFTFCWASGASTTRRVSNGVSEPDFAAVVVIGDGMVSGTDAPVWPGEVTRIAVVVSTDTSETATGWTRRTARSAALSIAGWTRWNQPTAPNPPTAPSVNTRPMKRPEMVGSWSNVPDVCADS